MRITFVTAEYIAFIFKDMQFSLQMSPNIFWIIKVQQSLVHFPCLDDIEWNRDIRPLSWKKKRKKKDKYKTKKTSKQCDHHPENHYYCNEPRHDKTNKMSVRPAKTQISLGIRPVWSESSLSAWRSIGCFATHWAHSEDSDQIGRMPRLIWVFARRTVTLLVLSCHGSNSLYYW